MRAVRLVLLCYGLLALWWAVVPPLRARLTVREMSAPGADLRLCERQLENEGGAALNALRGGLSASDPRVRLHCARLLALRDDRGGDRCLLELLRTYGKDPGNSIGVHAEGYLCEIWDRRDAPPEPLRSEILHLDAAPLSEPEKLALLNDTLSKNYAWASGYVRRARLYQRNGDPQEARRDALVALMLEPNQFEAMLVLGAAAMLAEAPQQASECFEQAIRLDPRLRYRYRKEIDAILRAVEKEKARRRKERRLDTPVANSKFKIRNSKLRFS